MELISRMSLFALILILSSSPVEALECDKALTQYDLNKCARKDLDSAEKKLEKIYKRLNSSSNEDQAKLEAANKAWLEYRKKQCEYNVAGFIDGTIYPMSLLACYEDMTYRQIDILQEQLNCEDGVINCTKRL